MTASTRNLLAWTGSGKDLAGPWIDRVWHGSLARKLLYDGNDAEQLVFGVTCDKDEKILPRLRGFNLVVQSLEIDGDKARIATVFPWRAETTEGAAGARSMCRVDVAITLGPPATSGPYRTMQCTLHHGRTAQILKGHVLGATLGVYDIGFGNPGAGPWTLFRVESPVGGFLAVDLEEGTVELSPCSGAYDRLLEMLQGLFRVEASKGTSDPVWRDVLQATDTKVARFLEVKEALNRRNPCCQV